MKILIAPDKFRGSLSAEEVISSIRKGIEIVDDSVEIVCQPMADGGEETAKILVKNSVGMLRKVKVKNPLFRDIFAEYGISGDKKTAFIEMSAASGLSLLDKNEHNPLKTSTFGTGELILDAIGQKVSHVILCIGGSATNDAGMGMATALGYRFLDIDGLELKPIGENLIYVFSIDQSKVHPKLKEIKFEIACDVTNPFYGRNGAAYVYAKQKGANEIAVKTLDIGLIHFAQIIENTFDLNLQNLAGSGAAGGLGGGSKAFLNAHLRSGVELMIDYLHLEETIKNADLIITAEGKIDQQTLSGKVVKGIATVAQKYQKPVIAFCGTLALNQQEISKSGLLAAFSILNSPMNLEKAQSDAAELLSDAVANVIRLFLRINQPLSNSKIVISGKIPTLPG